MPKLYIPFFWHHTGIILKEYTSVGIAIAKIYYADILVNKLHPEIKEQWRGLISAGVILHHDNAPAHTSFLVSSTIHDLKHELLRHPHYSPDLVSIDYFVFPVLKDYLKRRHYNNRSSLGSSICRCLNSMSEDDFTAAIKSFRTLAKMYFNGGTILRERAYRLIVVTRFVVL